MKSNLEMIVRVIDYVEDHLDDSLDLESLANWAGYSKYHLHRMFLSVTGVTLHTYVQRRRLTEAAGKLVYSEEPILRIAMSAGYETQQSFTKGFRDLFGYAPRAFRRKKEFYPVQLKFSADVVAGLCADSMTEIRVDTCEEMILVGYRENTAKGFFVIGKCWRKLYRNLGMITKRTDSAFMIGLNDYSDERTFSSEQPAFDYYAAIVSADAEHIPSGMVSIRLPSARYAVFCFVGNNRDPLDAVSEYIYKEWFPLSTCRLDESARYDFVKYGEQTDENGNSRIEYWVPIL